VFCNRGGFTIAEPSLPLMPARPVIPLAPKALFHFSPGHRPEDSNRHVSDR